MKLTPGRIVLIFLCMQGMLQAREAAGPIVEQVASKVQQNVITAHSYGYYQEVITSKKNSAGRVTKQEKRTFRTVWINNQPYNELIQISGRPLTSKEKIDESRRRSDFIKALYTSRKENGFQRELKSIQWWEIHKRYDFTLLPSEPDSKYVLSFQPKKEKLPERNRFDRVLNRLAGKIWLDEEFNVRKAEARLTNPVRFGLGILAKVGEINVHFTQQRHGDAWLPASLHLEYAADIALFRHDRNTVDVAWTNPYRNSGNLRLTTLAK